MLTKKITYTDFNDNVVTEEAQFHLTKSELMKMELSVDGGMYNTLRKMVDENQTAKLVEYFDNFIKASYGKKSEDGKRFVKTPEMTADFANSLAYDQLIVDLLSSSDEAVAFFQGIIPKEIASQMDTSEIDAMKAKANVASLGEATNADNNNT